MERLCDEACTWRVRLASDPHSDQIALDETDCRTLVSLLRHYKDLIVYVGYALWRKLLLLTVSSPHCLGGATRGKEGYLPVLRMAAWGVHGFCNKREWQRKNFHFGCFGGLHRFGKEYFVPGVWPLAGLPSDGGFRSFCKHQPESDQRDVVSLLLRAISPETFQGASPENIVRVLRSVYGSDTMLHLLLSNCSTTTKWDINESSLLHIAVMADNAAAVRYLLHRDPRQLKARNLCGSSAMHSVHSAEVAELLLAAGGDVNVINDSHWTPLHYLALPVSITNDRGHDHPQQPERTVQAAKVLIKHGADVDVQHNSGMDTPLHIAAFTGDLSLTEALLDGGANPNRQNDDGFTPLFEAAREEKSDVVALLMVRGADDTIKDKEGRNLLQSVRAKKEEISDDDDDY